MDVVYLTAEASFVHSGNHNDNNITPISGSTQDEILSNALHDFLVPLIRMVADHKGANGDLSKADIGSQKIIYDIATAIHKGSTKAEATKFTQALKEFVSSVVASAMQEVKTTVKIRMNDVEGGVEQKADSDKVDSLMHGASILQNHSKSSENLSMDHNLYTSKAPSIQFHEKFNRALREHVFNRMPIRLLCIKPGIFEIEISLIERGEIYTHLEQMAKGVGDQPESSLYGLKLVVETDEEAIKRLISNYASYAILSHTWLREAPGEITYSDWNKGTLTIKHAGYRKLINFCKVIWGHHGLTLAWMDTLCINKDSSTELDESIRCMYAWYRRAKTCIVYLAESQMLSEMHLDSWFTRGWTLQELLAPDVVKFYNRDWKKLVTESHNDKSNGDILYQIERATRISTPELHDILSTSLSRRMELAASRKVTREEDIAYSLMGIFDVSIATAYGEGAMRAFYRLLQEILNSTPKGALDLINWAGQLPGSWFPATRILPPNPQHYVYRAAEVSLQDIQPLEPLALTHMGLRIPVVLMPGILVEDTNSAQISIGRYSALADVWRPGFNIPTAYHVLDYRVSGPDRTTNSSSQVTFAVFNIRQGAKGVLIPRTCIAILLECKEAAGKVTSTGQVQRLDTIESIVFDLDESRDDLTIGHDRPGFDQETEDDDVLSEVPIDELKKHGMQLISLYL